MNIPTEWLPSAQVPRTVVSLIRGLLKEGLTRVLEDPSLGPAIITEIGRRFAETDVPLKIGGTSRRLTELFPPDELAYLRYSVERSIASACLQYKLTETALQQMMHRPERVTAALRSTYSHVEPGYIASWLDDDYVMHGRDGYPRDSGRHAFMQAAVEHLTVVWELVDGPAWQDLAAIKDERTRDRAPILNSIPPHRRAELDLPAHSVDEFDIPGNNTVLSAATNMGSVLIVLRGYLESLAEHADVIEGWPWARIQHGVLEFASRLSVMAGVTFTTLGDFTEPRHPPRFAVEFDTARRTITSVAITGPAKQARAADRGGVCPGFVTFYPAGEAEVSTGQLRRSLAGVDVEPHRSSSGSNIAMMVGGFLLPLLGRDYPQLRLTRPTLTDLMTGQSVDPSLHPAIPPTAAQQTPVELAARESAGKQLDPAEAIAVTAPRPPDSVTTGDRGSTGPSGRIDSRSPEDVDRAETPHPYRDLLATESALRAELAVLVQVDPNKVRHAVVRQGLNMVLAPDSGASGLPGAGTGGATAADMTQNPAAAPGESDRPPGLIGSRPPEGFEPIDPAREDRRSPRGSRGGSTPPEAYAPVDPVHPHPWRRSLGADHTGPLPDPCAETPHRPAGATPWSGSPGNSPHQPAAVQDDS
jgi:hypothetical protein